MKDRIKEVRKYFGLTQAEFGKMIGVKGNTVATYESGDRSPSASVIDLICEKFGVDFFWLSCGIDQMFAEKPEDEHLASFYGKIIAGGGEEIQRAFAIALSHSTVEELEAVKSVVMRLFDAFYDPGADSEL